MDKVEPNTHFAFANNTLCWREKHRSYINVLNLKRVMSRSQKFTAKQHAIRLDLSPILTQEQIIAINRQAIYFEPSQPQLAMHASPARYLTVSSLLQTSNML